MTENTLATVNPNGANARAEETRSGAFFTPRVDIIETEDALWLYADMPGVHAGDIDLRYEKGELILRGKVQPGSPKGHVVFGEFEVGDFYRVFQVHETIDASKIEAEHKNGVLTVRLPKQEAVKPKQVAIKAQA
ncbi:MAG: Hsp20/alpha crystallin family protein [Planctomycetes bacterium]|nr:Hsp20/alpha crystallin family protein [Planctomycetota bacterium]